MEARIRIVAGLAMAIIAVGAPELVHAADSRLDDAQAHLVKARELVKAAEPSSTGRAYGQHTKRAENLINQAIREINLAKNAAAAPPKINLNRSPSMGTGATPNPSGLIQLNPQPEPPSRGVDQLAVACADYATFAVEQNRLNHAAQCGLSGPRWSDDIKTHREWCVTTRAVAAASEIAARQTALNACPRNNRQLAASQFQNANQKANQYINMLSSVMKTLNETQRGTIRNMQ